jgi:hypothetical protein
MASEVTQDAPPVSPAASGGSGVRRRKVLYVHGFDPRGPGPYHRMFAEEAQRQAAVSGWRIDVGPRRNQGAETATWSVQASFDGQAVQTSYLFLRWDDVVRGLWTQDDRKLFVQMWAWLGTLLSSPHFGRARRLAGPGILAMLLPPVAVCGFLLVLAAVTAGLGLAGLAIGERLVGAPWAAAGALLGLLPLALAPALWRRIDQAANISWLSRCLTFICDASSGRLAALQARSGRFAQRILAEARAGGVDEVLVVGHSQGASVAVLAMASALRAEPGIGQSGPTLALLTLGQPISLWTLLGGEAFRSDLKTLAAAAQVAWLDVTSPSDGASACRMSPLIDIEGAAPQRVMRRSPRFHAILEAARFKTIRRRPFDYHFQYLKASDTPRAFDFFRLTCGPEPLRDFAGAWTEQVLAEA